VIRDITGLTTKGIEITEGVYLLKGLSSNVVAVVTPDSVLLIDSGSSGDVKRLKKIISMLSTGPIRIVLNTHFHFDHIGGNEALAEGGVVIIGNEGVYRRMLDKWQIPKTLGINYPTIPPYPQVALPKLTFVDSIAFRFGEQEIKVLHFPNAHTDADGVVFLRGSNVIHTGDLYLSNGFPPIDSFHGGTIDGVLSALDSLIELIDDHTKVVSGHGEVTNRKELRAYRQMLKLGRDRIADLIDEGMTLEEIVAADPLAGLYNKGKSWLPPKLFIWTVYVDLVRR
jgi:glyoxylase-like metal-dependent hydrolase (beta-lactamase superfamily II)